MSPHAATGRRVGLLLMVVGVVAGLFTVVNAVAVANGLWRVRTDLLVVGVALGLVAYPVGYAIREGVAVEAIDGSGLLDAHVGELLDAHVIERFRRSDR